MKFIVLILCSLVLFSQAYTQQTGPGFKIKETVHNCHRFEADSIHPTRYILSTPTNYGEGPVIYDIQEKKLIRFPLLSKLEGIDEAPDAKPATDEYKRLRQEGQLWKWGYKTKIVYYDAEKGYAGILFEKDATVRTIEGEPDCQTCGRVTELIEKYQRFYCYTCKKYVEEDVYLKDVNTFYYGRVNLNTMKVEKMNEIPGEGILYLTGDPSGKYLYFSNQLYFYGKVSMIDKISLVRYNTETDMVDWFLTFNVVPRKKSEELPSHSLSAVITPDGGKIVFIEYDEGMLKNPGPRGYILDVEKKEVITVAIPQTAYGIAFDRKAQRIFLGSNQKGTLHRINLDTGKEEIKVQAAGTIFHMLLSPESKYVYIFNKKKIEVRSYPDLVLLKTLPLSSVFNGISELLASETVYTTADGKYSAIGILKKEGQWASSDLYDGFYLLETLE